MHSSQRGLVPTLARLQEELGHALRGCAAGYASLPRRCTQRFSKRWLVRCSSRSVDRSQRGKLVCALCACSSCVCSGRPTRAHLSFIHSPPHSCRIQARLCWPSTARSTQVPNSRRSSTIVTNDDQNQRDRRGLAPQPRVHRGPGAHRSAPGRALQEAMVAGRRGSEGAGGAGMGWRGGVRRSGGLNQAGIAGAGARRRSGGLARSRS